MPVSSRYRPAPLHPRLGPALFDEVAPARFPAHVLRFRNQRWAARVGLDTLADDEWIDHLARFVRLPDNLPRPLALRYHGHQFGAYNPRLGDGRGFLFAQLQDDAGRLLDLGTKGSGPTPYARGFDGRLTLQGGVRELLATELLEALGVDTSKTFSLVETGEALQRSDEPSPTRGAVLVRLSHGHVRIGTFQRLAAEGDTAALARLVAHCLACYPLSATPDVLASSASPDAATLAASAPAALAPATAAEVRAFLAAVVRRGAYLAAAWMTAGFVHGVVNSDNVNVTGESFDYGPWRFLPHLDPSFVAAYFDHGGYYAYGRQPQAVLRNLRYLVDALSPLVPLPELAPLLDAFAPTYAEARRRHVLWRLGLVSGGPDADDHLVAALDGFLEASRAPLDQAWFDLRGGHARLAQAFAGPNGNLYRGPAWRTLVAALGAHAPHPGATAHPRWRAERPPSLVIEEVRRLWQHVADDDDWAPLHAALDDIRAFGDALAIAPPPRP